MCLILLKYDNNVVFTGDEWDYQSIGVNSYYGYEFLTTGRLEEAEVYRFTALDNGKIRFWEGFSGKKAFYRVPFYPLFVSFTYKLFGINPIIIKYIQLFIVVTAGLLLVFIGRMVWNERGLYIGYLSFILFVGLNCRFTAHLMPENWQLLFLSAITICLLFHYRGSLAFSMILGLTLGLSCLNKGTTFLLLPLIIVSDILYWRIRNRSHWKNLILFMVFFAVITGPWSLYVSNERNELTFLSAQTNEVLLDGNNEFCSDGLWHPEWRDIADSWYNTDKMDSKSGAIRVLNFYVNNPREIANLTAKFKAGFATVPSFNAMISIYLVFLTSCMYFKSRCLLSGLSRASAVLFALLILIFSICFGIWSRLINDYMFISFIAFIILLSAVFTRRLKQELKLPMEFFIILLNFLIFTLAFYVCNETYPSRYVKTMDGVFLLSGFYFLLRIFECSQIKYPEVHKN